MSESKKTPMKVCKLVQCEKAKNGKYDKEDYKVLKSLTKVTESYFDDFNDKSFPTHGQLYIELTEEEIEEAAKAKEEANAEKGKPMRPAKPEEKK